MTHHNNVVVVLVVLTIAFASMGGLAKQSDTEVIFDRNGNALIAYGGSKDKLPTFSSLTANQLDRISSTSRSADGTFELRKSKTKSFGNGHVGTEFHCDVDWGVEFWYVWREIVDGITITYWTGDVPQSLSDLIELDESWKFYGLSVSVSFSGPGVSGSGNTIRFSGDDGGTGTHWYLAHIYAGYYAQSYIAMTSTRQTSAGLHRFNSTWVTASATDSGSP